MTHDMTWPIEILPLPVILLRTPMHLAAEKGHTSTVEFLAGDSPTLNEVVHNTNKYC